MSTKTTWGYKTLRVEESGDVFEDNSDKRIGATVRVLERLKGLGDQGWELVAIEARTSLYVLKRDKTLWGE